MRDFYHRLGLLPSASESEIRAALNSYTGQQPSPQEIGEILLSPHRKKVYDRAWITLYSLGRIRANLSVQDDFWEHRNSDFSTTSDGYPPLRAQQNTSQASSSANVEQQNREGGKNPAQTNTRFFYNLRMGNFSLAKTFWLYGFLFPFFFNMFTRLISTEEFLQSVLYHLGELGLYIIIFVIELLVIAYSINVYVGIWRAADKYNGPLIWRRLAKIMVCIWWCFLFVFVAQMIVLFGSVIQPSI